MKLFVAAFLLAAPVAALAQEPAAPAASNPGSNVTVRGPERMVCRAVTRTATRMRSSRVCRPVSQWSAASGPQSDEERLAEAADTLETLGEKVSTNCTGGMGGGHNGPLGPR